jgi:hypothetical protein
VQKPLTSGPRGWLVSPTLQPLVGWLHRHALQEEVTYNLKLEVSGSRTWWPPGHMSRLVGQHLACYRLNQVVNTSLDSYKYPSADGIQDTTLYMYFSTCKGYSLVVAA